MKKEIAFGGVTRVPGGALSSDGDLCAAVDVCNDGMGLELLEKPEELFELSQGEELLCVHEPEGEGKHYITQLVVAAQSNSAPALRGISESEPSAPRDFDFSTYAGNYTPTTSDSSASIQPYTPPVEVVTDVTASDFEANITELHDNGGETVSLLSGETLSAGIYLCYWVKENEEYIRKPVIDITPYGKVTAIQPMGNTLVCNHEGGEDYPAEIRYWLWKAENEEYIGLGAKPPFVNISFGLNSTFEYYPKTANTFNGGALKKYGGVFVTSYPYTDTVPLYWNKFEGMSYVPPLSYYKDGTFNIANPPQTTDDDVFSHWQSSYSIDGVESPDGKTDVAGMRTNWTTMVLGCYNKFIAEQHKKNKFVFPFYARYAIELYDGSLIMHSNPVLMIPNSRGPIFALDGKKGLKADLDDAGKNYEKVRIEFRGRTYGFSSTLMHLVAKLSAEDQARLENWKDLIRGINIYVTPPIYNYKQGGQVLGWKCMSEENPEDQGFIPWAHGEWSRYYTVGKTTYTDVTEEEDKTFNGCYSMFWAFDQILPDTMATDHKNDIFIPWSSAPADTVPDYILDIPQKEIDEITQLHENAGQFYKLGSIDYEDLIELTQETSPVEKAIDIGNNKVNTIANQDIMQDDNGSHDTLSADVLYGYNRRLNMASVSKVLHSPLLPSVTFAKDYDAAHNYEIVIRAKNGSQIARLKSSETSVQVGFPQYIFYPDPNAFEALIYRQFAGSGTATVRYKVPLKEHKALNGAFWLADFYNNISDIENYGLDGYASAEELALPEENKVVDESNKIYTSETDNPFYVPLGNINIAGGGEVRALAAATEAMSQGQFGQHPMYTFTSEGVWAMTVTNTGGWGTIQPVTRDVISEGTLPLSLDSTVVFLTERGLLQLAGSQVKVLSDVLQGADPLLLNTPNFGLHRLDELCDATDTELLLGVATDLAVGKFPEEAWLAYDYDNARIYVSPWEANGSWVYNLKSQIWTQASVNIDRQITSYPELETQSGGKVVKISVDRAILSNLCSKGLVVTRPIKFGDMGLLKRWREMAVRGRFKPYSTAVQVALWGTRDWVDSALVASSTRNILTRWGGSPYFGHSVGLFLTKPAYAMQVAGLDAEVVAERDNKLR